MSFPHGMEQCHLIDLVQSRNKKPHQENTKPPRDVCLELLRMINRSLELPVELSPERLLVSVNTLLAT